MSLDESEASPTSAPSQSSGTSIHTMATAINLPTFHEFELQPRDTAPTRFEKYVKRLNNMFTAMSITQASRKKAMLLHYVGEETCDVFETLTVPELTEGNDEYKIAVKALTITSNLRSVLINTCASFIRNRKRLVRTSTSFARVFSSEFADTGSGNKAANNSKLFISSPETQSNRAKLQPGEPAQACTLNGNC